MAHDGNGLYTSQTVNASKLSTDNSIDVLKSCIWIFYFVILTFSCIMNNHSTTFEVLWGKESKVQSPGSTCCEMNGHCR